MSVEISIQGLDKFLSICDPARFLKEMDRAVNRAAEMLRDETKRLPPVSAKRTGYGEPGIPVDTGRLRQSIQKRKLQLLGAEVYVPVQYSGYVHDGTSRVPARPFFRWELEEFGGLERVEIILNAALERVVQP